MDAVNVRQAQPDLAQQIYQQYGLDHTKVRLAGVRDSVGKLRPGDLVGWLGGDEQDGKYNGNIALYAGDGQIIEQFFGKTRRRMLNANENTFGMPVHIMDDGE